MGFQVDRFSQQPPPEFICIICTCVLDDPVQCGNQHNFCRRCITKWLSTLNDGTGELNGSCPACRCEMSIQRLKEGPGSLRRRLSKLKILCSHRNCDSGFLDLDQIVRHEDQCKYQPDKIHCIFGCGEFFFAEEEMTEHIRGCNKYVDFLLELENNEEADSSASSIQEEVRNAHRPEVRSVGGGSTSQLVIGQLSAQTGLPTLRVASGTTQTPLRWRTSTIISIILAFLAFIALLCYLLFQFGKDVLKSLHIIAWLFDLTKNCLTIRLDEKLPHYSTWRKTASLFDLTKFTY